MIRFRCTACRQLVGVADGKVGHRITCPTCKGKMIVPAASPEDPPQSKNATAKRRLANEEEVVDELEVIEEVEELEVIEEVEEVERSPRRRKRRPQRGHDRIPDYYRRKSSVNLPLIMLCILVPLELLLDALFFFVSPPLGIAGVMWGVGWIWINMIAAEDGLGTVLCLNFVPFYALIYAYNNIDRVWIPYLLIFLGGIAFGTIARSAKIKNPGRQMHSPPAPLLRTFA